MSQVKDYDPRHVTLEATPQDFTGAWVDLGGEIDTRWFNTLTLWFQVDVNDGSGLMFRVLGKNENGVAEYSFPIETTTAAAGAAKTALQDSVYEFEAVDQNILVNIDLKGTIPVCQVQIMATTPGATAAQIDAAYYTLGY
jgi:hypothetical protein